MQMMQCCGPPVQNAVIFKQTFDWFKTQEDRKIYFTSERFSDSFIEPQLSKLFMEIAMLLFVHFYFGSALPV